MREASARVEPADAALLVAHALGHTRTWLYAHGDDAIDAAARQACERLVARCEAGEPAAYIVGRRGFWRFELRVTPDTLVPRPETELLVELALERMSADRPLRVADLGTGSGAIALALAHERPLARVIAVDASAAALEVARGNAAALGAVNIEFREGDWLQSLAGERFDLIASNPPYIALGDPHLDDLRHEPALALSSGADGLDAIRAIVRDAPAHLLDDGWLLLEHGLDQGAAVRALLAEAGFEAVSTVQDLERRDRVTLGRYNRPGHDR